MFDRIIALCRPGFEKECAAELQTAANQLGIAAWVQANTNDAYVQLVRGDSVPAETLFAELDFRNLIFTRQWFAAGPLVKLPETNRLEPLLELIQRTGMHCCDVEQSWPDTNTGKSMRRFCRQFDPHLCQALQQHQLLTPNAAYRLHLLWLDSSHVYVGLEKKDNSDGNFMGIQWLMLQ